MNFDIIEELTIKDINKLYEEYVINDYNTNLLSWDYMKCYFSYVRCSDGKILRDVYLCTNMMNEVRGQTLNNYYKNPANACYEMCDNNYNVEGAGCTMTGYVSSVRCYDYRYNY